MQMSDNYIYETEEMIMPFNKYRNENGMDTENMFYYYKQQTPKQTIEIKHNPNSPSVIDIYNNPDYHDVDTDTELDMDAEYVTSDGQGEEDDNDLLNTLTKYLATIQTTSTEYYNTETKRPIVFTKKYRKGIGNHRITRANRVRPKMNG